MMLISYRRRPSGGMYWKKERDVSEKNKAEWLKIFSSDEPTVMFKVVKRQKI